MCRVDQTGEHLGWILALLLPLFPFSLYPSFSSNSPLFSPKALTTYPPPPLAAGYIIVWLPLPSSPSRCFSLFCMMQLLFLASQEATSRRTSSLELQARHISMRVLLLRMAGAQAFGIPSPTQDDVKLMIDTNLEAYRFSISWSRLIPSGRGAVNQKGLEYYNNLIDELVKRGIQVHVMLYQLDLPQVLDDEYGGWLSPRIVEDFTAYADVCFREFGDRVSYWTTIDEPNVAAIGSYDTGQIPPGRCSDPFGLRKCTVGNSTVEPYIAAHNMLLAHASAARLYRGKYVAVQKGVVGINVYSFWTYPLTNSTMDLEATKRCQDFMFGWILEPLVFGDYPQVMKKIVGSRLPSFTKVQCEAVSSMDFIGINHYFSLYVNDRPLDKGVRDYAADMSVYYRGSKTDPPIGKHAPSFIPNDPRGLQLALQYLKESYGDLPIYIQENGNASSNDTVHDTDRIDFSKRYIGGTLAALRNGVNVKGYFAWAFMDVFEILSGYQARYGLYRVDFDDEARPRQARLSARWYSNFLKNTGIHIPNELEDAGSHAQQ